MSGDRFLSLFGVNPDRIRPFCVLLPSAPRGVLRELGVEKLIRGRLYGIGQARDFTVIHTGMGSLRVGDAVLELADTPARRLLLFGTCGLLSSRDAPGPGDLVTPVRAFAAESFTDLLRGRAVEKQSFHPDPAFQQNLLSLAAATREVTLLSVGSLKLEEERQAAWIKEGIEAVDLESAAFLAAAAARRRAAVSLLLVSDIVGEEPFYRDFSPPEQSRLNQALREGAKIICRLSEQLKD